MAKRLKKKNIEIVPGYKLCRQCVKELEVIEKQADDENDIATPKQLNEDENMSENELSDYEMFATPPKKKLNTSLSSVGISPVNLHGVPQHTRAYTAKLKLTKVMEKFKSELSEAYSVEDIPLDTNLASISTDVQTKAKDLDKLHESMRDKLVTACYTDKVQILTLIPDSWSRKFAANYFNVSEYMIRTARELKKEKGVLAKPKAKQGKNLTLETLQLVSDFYEDDEYTRLMPGKKRLC